MGRVLCVRCRTRLRAALLPTDADLIRGTAALHAQLRRAADLPRSALVTLKDWEDTLRAHVRKGHYCRPCLQVWAAAIPTHPYSSH